VERLQVINALCFDIDDLAHGLNVRNGSRLKSNYLVEKETYSLLESLEVMRISATMFVPGYVAARFPRLVREFVRKGHEVASHGYTHIVPARLERKGFREDVLKGKKILEDILSVEVNVYKAPEWGITAKTPWAYDELIAVGYKVDHTAQPALLRFLGRRDDDMKPFIYKDSLTVIPVTSCNLAGHSVPFSGGFFCAYVPAIIQAAHYRRLNRRGMAFNYYCHPFEIYPAGFNRHAWRYGSVQAAFYGAHFGIYRHHVSYLAKRFKFAPLRAAYSEYLPHGNVLTAIGQEVS
jgi:polysaccharide deacetylase family protein (PEP-CTERM system associated)